MMISTDTSIDHARRARRPARRDDVMRAGAGLGFSLSLGIGSALDDNAAFHPSQASGCRAFWDLTEPTTLVYGTTFRATGGGPVVTLTRQPTIATALRIECTSAVAFRWSNDGGATWVASGVTIPNGSTYDAGDSGEFTFALGVYANTHVYEVTLAQWKSLVSATDVWAQATATKQARVVAGPTGADPTIALRSDGVDDLYKMSTIAVGSPGAGNQTFWWGVVRFDAYSSNDQLIGSDNGRVALSFSAVANTLQQASGVVGNATVVALNTFGGVSALFRGSTADFVRWKGGAPSTGVTAGGTAPLNTVLYLFNRNDVATTMMQASLCCFGLYNAVPTAIATMEAWANAKFGTVWA